MKRYMLSILAGIVLGLIWWQIAIIVTGAIAAREYSDRIGATETEVIDVR